MNTTRYSVYPPSRSATERPPSLAKLRAPVPSASNLRHRAFYFGVGCVLAVVCLVVWWPIIRAAFPQRSTSDIECAAVAKIDQTTEVIVCVRGIRERYPKAQPRPETRA